MATKSKTHAIRNAVDESRKAARDTLTVALAIVTGPVVYVGELVTTGAKIVRRVAGATDTFAKASVELGNGLADAIEAELPEMEADTELAKMVKERNKFSRQASKAKAENEELWERLGKMEAKLIELGADTDGEED